MLKEAKIKKISPNVWGPAAVGTVEPDETYETNIYKEAEEEIGLKNIKFKPFIKKFFQDEDGLSRFTMWFTASYDAPIESFVLQVEEVDSVKWKDKAELYQDLIVNPDDYVQSSKYWPELFPL